MHMSGLQTSLSTLLKVSCLGAALLSLSGCGGGSGSSSSIPTKNTAIPSAVADAAQRGVPVDSGIVAADNSFGFDLLAQLTAQSPTQNVFISPTSLAIVLDIIYNGAAGSTQQAMAQTLHLQGQDAATVDTKNAALQASLINPDPQVQLDIANSLWLAQSYPIQTAFIQANTTYYGSQIGNTNGVPASVNAWVDSQTDGKITTILPPGDYSNTAAIVVNAIYFNGKWTQQFDTSQTQSAPFTRLDSSTVTCQLMTQTSTYGYYKGDTFQAVRLPYGSGRLSMIVALPNAGADWTTFLARMNQANWSAWLPQFQNTYGSIWLPRFQTDYSASLKDTLTTLGMGVAFDPSSANFSALAPDLYLQFIYHKTYLSVTEQGTVAAGVTGGGIAITSIPVPAFKMRMDHPFFCAIRDDKTGALLFVGCIVDPTA